jgi:serine/threonine-protein kinase
VGDYELLGRLGRGGMGVVYQARDHRLDRLVALKMILAGAHADPEELARFRAEAQAQARLQHPNIVQVYEVGEADGWPYFALEYVDGGSLEKRLAGLPQPARWAAGLVETLARAMHHAHQQGLVHRDLKPANVLLAADGTPKVTDFGLAKRLQAEAGKTPSGAVVGTPSYMAPEQTLSRPGAVGPAADVYALGAILYECLTGRPPFLAETALDTLVQLQGQEPVPPRRLQPKVPRDLDTICLKCLEKESARRYASALALADDLSRFQAGEPIRARPVGLAGRLGRWARRQPVVAGLAAALVLALVGGFAAVAWQWIIAEGNWEIAERNRVQAEANAKRAEQQRRVAVLQAAEARRQWERARDSYRLSREALEACVKRVAEDPRLKEGLLEDLRRRVLEADAVFYEKFVKLQGDEPEFQAERGRAYLRLGDVMAQLASPEKALRPYGKALAVFQRLVEQHPANRFYQNDLAGAHNQLANKYRALARFQDAERAHREALALRQVLVAKHPGVPEYRVGLAASHNNRALLYLETNRPKDAEHDFGSARKILERLVDEQPNAAQYKEELAGNYNNLGNLYWSTSRYGEAEKFLRDALALRKALAAKHADNADYQNVLAGSHQNLGVLYRDTARPKEALAACNAALVLRKALAARHPGVPSYQAWVASNHLALASMYHHTAQPEIAVQALEEACAIYKTLADLYPTIPIYQRGRINALRQLGEMHLDARRPQKAEPLFQEALARSRDLVKNYPSDWHRLEWGMSQSQIGLLYLRTNRAKLAEPVYREVRDRFQRLAAKQPSVGEFREKLAIVHYNLTLARAASGQPRQAEQSYRDAVAVQKTLLGMGNRRADSVIALGVMQLNLGNLLRDQDRPDDALAWNAEAVETLAAIVAGQTADQRARIFLGRAYKGRALTLTRLGRHAEALKDWERARGLDDGRSSHWLTLQRALTLARLGEHVRATAEAAALERLQGVPANVLHDMARVYALSAAAAREEAALANRYAARAVALLRQAQATGLFQDPAQVGKLRKDPNLSALRSRDDYRQWVGELEKAKTPGP